MKSNSSRPLKHPDHAIIRFDGFEVPMPMELFEACERSAKERDITIEQWLTTILRATIKDEKIARQTVPLEKPGSFPPGPQS